MAVPRISTPAPRPTVLWTARLTTSSSSGAPAAWAVLYSKSMARSIWGSPTIRPKPKAASAARMPTSIPRMRNVRIISVVLRRSVAGEAEEVATVVHELVDVVAVDDRRGALFGTDEVEEDQHEQATEDGVGEPLAHRDGDRLRFDVRCDDCGHGSHA